MDNTETNEIRTTASHPSQDFANRLSVVITRFREQQLTLAKLKTRECLQRYLHTMVRIEMRFSFAVLIFGIIMANFGFWLWFTKLQRPQDKLLKKQNAEQRAQLDP